eukprot:7779722-Prorocentrum_lima.AAC.1
MEAHRCRLGSTQFGQGPSDRQPPYVFSQPTQVVVPHQAQTFGVAVVQNRQASRWLGGGTLRRSGVPEDTRLPAVVWMVDLELEE